MPCLRVFRPLGQKAVFDVLTKFAREAAATLLRFAKTTSDPNVAAALVEKAADLKDRLDNQAPRRLDATEPKVIQKQQDRWSRWRL
jgi:hypothetical protein